MRKTPEINFQSQKIDRNVNDLIQWKERKEKCQAELKRNMQIQQELNERMLRSQKIISSGSLKYL